MDSKLDLSFCYDAVVKTDEPLKNHCTLRIGGNARYFVTVKSLCSLRELVDSAKRVNMPYKVVGNGSNLLFSDDGYDGLIISLSGLSDISFSDFGVRALAGANLNSLIEYTVASGYSGIENLVGIPATVGGATVMNAGAFGKNISNHIVKVETVKDGKLKRYDKEECRFSYRKSRFLGSKEIITAVYFDFPKKDGNGNAHVLEYLERRRAAQPFGRTCGSVFKNPKGDYAGRIIEECGLKGLKVGGASVSEIHANFILAHENATASDVRTLINKIKETVYKKKGIVLHEEVEYVR